MRPVLGATLLVLAVGFVWLAAGGGEDGAQAAVRIAIQSDGRTLDPHLATQAASMRLAENLHATLLRYTERYGGTEPGLAESLDVSADGRRYTFRLRAGARFHGGHPVTADDVRWSLERIRREGERRDQLACVERIETPDARTVVLHLRAPTAPLRTWLAYPMNAILDRTERARFARGRGGCGPYTLADWRADDACELERFPDYFLEGRPRSARLTYRILSDETARTAALRNGEVDIVLDVPAKDVALLREAPGVTVKTAPGTFWEYLGLNCRRPPLDDARVRRALAWAVDRDALAAAVKFGHAAPLRAGPIPPGHWAACETPVYPRRDIARARALLEDAGHAGGIDLVCKTTSAVPYQVQAAQVLKQQLADAGVRMEIRALENGVFFDALAGRDFDACVVGWVGFVDPDEFLYNLFHSAGSFNQQGFADARIDALLERGRAETARATRRTVYREAQRAIAAAAPMVFLYANHQISAVRDGVRGFVVHPTASTIFLRETVVER